MTIPATAAQEEDAVKESPMPQVQPTTPEKKDEMLSPTVTVVMSVSALIAVLVAKGFVIEEELQQALIAEAIKPPASGSPSNSSGQPEGEGTPRATSK